MSRGAGLRFGAVIATDLRLRLRQTSTLVVFLLLSALPYLWVPDPATGRAVFVVDGRRVVYDSAALGLATSVLCSFLLGLFGYYLVSHSLARDVRTRCGYVIASTPVGNFEYLLAKASASRCFLPSGCWWNHRRAPRRSWSAPSSSPAWPPRWGSSAAPRRPSSPSS